MTNKRPGLTAAGGQMYPWADWTWNPLAGECTYECKYCYIKSPPANLSDKYHGDLRLQEKVLNADLKELPLNRREALSFVGHHPVVFVCSCSDPGAASADAFNAIVRRCGNAPWNYYLFQSKNPQSLARERVIIPPRAIFGTTLETNRAELCKEVSKAPPPDARIVGLDAAAWDDPTMVSIEPIMAFDLDKFVPMIRTIGPKFVSIGADSKNHGLPEPTADEIRALILELKRFTDVKIKDNLGRLMG